MDQFTLTNVQSAIAILTKQIDAELDADTLNRDIYELYCEDRGDYCGIADLLFKGEVDAAVIKWQDLDTVARDYIYL